MIPDHHLVKQHRDSQKRSLCILGSTGSIGTQTLDIVRLFPDRLDVRVLTAGTNAGKVIRQAKEFHPDLVVLSDEEAYRQVKEALHHENTEVAHGTAALENCVEYNDVNTVVAAIVGFAGLRPVIRATEAGHRIALANKETLVVAGSLINRSAKRHKAVIIPVDSEHSALFQCLVGESGQQIESLVLTASGGPFRTRAIETFASITREEALNHPNWDMGAKITIDSATMMNKGLEVIEARWLFDLGPDKIDVVVHPQSIVHSMVVYQDGSTKAQLGVPDMKVPIQYALTFPDRWPADHPRLDWSEVKRLDFEPPDLSRFPCLDLAYDALRSGGVAPAVLNAANEAAVDLFLNDNIHFTEIPGLIADALNQDFDRYNSNDLDEITAVDSKTRAYVRSIVASATQ